LVAAGWLRVPRPQSGPPAPAAKEAASERSFPSPAAKYVRFRVCKSCRLGRRRIHQPVRVRTGAKPSYPACFACTHGGGTILTVLREAVGRARHRRLSSLTAATGNPTRDKRPRGEPPGRSESHPPRRASPHYWRGSVQAAGAGDERRACTEVPIPCIDPATCPLLTDASNTRRQEAGIAALVSVTRSEAPTAHVPAVPARLG